VRGLRGTLPNLRAIILTENPERFPRPLRYPPGEVCVVPVDLPLLPRRIAWVRFDAWKSRVRTQLRDLTHLPLALRAALVAALDQRIPVWIENGETIHTVEAVARKIGVSRGYLSRTAGSDGVALAAYLDACNALNAIAEAEIEERSWGEVAVRMGYSWQSGLTQLLKRGMGVTPRLAKSRSLGHWAVWWECHILEPLVGQGDEGHTE
jgi:AraC-like DNA-binding protein